MKNFLKDMWPFFVTLVLTLVLGIVIGLGSVFSGLPESDKKLEAALVRAESCESSLRQYEATLTACVLMYADEKKKSKCNSGI